MERPERPESGPGPVRETHVHGERDKRNHHFRPTVIFQDILREKQKIHNGNKGWVRPLLRKSEVVLLVGPLPREFGIVTVAETTIHVGKIANETVDGSTGD